MNAILLTFDRLPTGFLGCYGNGWIATPNFDRLAATSVVFDQHFSETVDPAAPRQSWSTGRYECRRALADRPAVTLPALLEARGVAFRLLIDSEAERTDGELQALAPEAFEVVAGQTGLDVADEDTPFSKLVARAHHQLRLLKTSRREPWFLWIRSHGIPSPCLAPRTFASRFLDLADEESEDGSDNARAAGEEDADVLDADDRDADEGAIDDSAAEDDGLVELSAAEFDDLLAGLAAIPDDFDAIARLSGVERRLLGGVVGGSVALLDAGLGRLLDQVEAVTAGTPTLFIACAARGLAVRGASVLAGGARRLDEEVVHAPLFVRAGTLPRGVRRRTLVQPIDVVPTMADWFELDMTERTFEGQSLLPLIRGEASHLRQRAFTGGAGRAAGIRTEEHCLVVDCDDAAHPGRRYLFAKPEDIWNTNDLAHQLPDAAEQLSLELEGFFNDGDAAN